MTKRSLSKAKTFFSLLLIGIYIIVLYSFTKSGALTQDFSTYFKTILSQGEDVPYITGSKFLDTACLLFAFPGLIATYAFSLSMENGTRCITCFSLCGILLFCYLYQVNYPLIQVFWMSVFCLILDYTKLPRFWFGFFLSLIVVALGFSSFNRYGEFSTLALRKYFVEYNTIGFSYYDSKLADNSSLLHERSYGRSSLGVLDQFVATAVKTLSGDVTYISANAENVAQNAQPVDIGLHEAIAGNAFATINFTFYRDFGVSGIILGGLIYGFVLRCLTSRATTNVFLRPINVILCAGWAMSLMVSPLERPFFWITILILLIMAVFCTPFRLGTNK